jgi:hypothetical protein
LVINLILNPQKGASVDTQQFACYLVLKLLKNSLARSQLVHRRFLHKIMPFLASKDAKLVGLWYQVAAQLCNFSEFREQIENDIEIVGFFRKCLEIADVEFGKEIVFMFRTLSKSALILKYFVSSLTLPVLFNFFADFLAYADKQNTVFILETLRIMAESPVSQQSLLQTVFVLRLLLACMAKEDMAPAAEAVTVLLELMERANEVRLGKIIKLGLFESSISFIMRSDETNQDEDVAENLKRFLLNNGKTT